MYAIIFWKSIDDDDMFFVKNNNQSIMEFSKLKDADEHANDIDFASIVACSRVISLSGVNE